MRCGRKVLSYRVVIVEAGRSLVFEEAVVEGPVRFFNVQEVALGAPYGIDHICGLACETASDGELAFWSDHRVVWVKMEACFAVFFITFEVAA